MTSDNGASYSSTLLATIAVILKIKQSLAPAHHPQSNGTVERFMEHLGTFRSIIVSYTNEVADHGKWDEHLGVF
jgi:transposase InsO family protein